MNYLAHFHLADGCDELLIGALLGDFVKGPLKGAYPEGWERGIHLHRRIDAITDSDPQLREFARSLGSDYRRYAGILLDICFDRALTVHWARFLEEPIDVFAQRIYRVLTQYSAAIPPEARLQAEKLVEFDVLSGFHQWWMVEGAIERVAARLKRGEVLLSASQLLAERWEAIEACFLAFYPELMQQIERERATLLRTQ